MPSRRPRPTAAAALFAALLASALFATACSGQPQANPEAIAPPAAAGDQQASASGAASGDAAASGAQDPAAGGESEEQQAESAAAQAADQAGSIAYFVVGGDTLASIAERFGVSLGALIAFNNLTDPNAIVVGQLLLIPTGEQAEPEAEQAAPEPPPPPPTAELPANIQLPAGSTPWATPISTMPAQFPQPPATLVLADPPPRPERFLDYGAHALPWLQGRTTIDEIVQLFSAWPMPPLAVRPNRVYLIDASGDGRSSIAVIFTNPDSFAADVPHSNLVIFDPLPDGDGPDTRYRIAYDHALAYGREPQGIEMIADADLTGDNIRDLLIREISCDREICTSAYAILDRVAEGYRVITGPEAVIADVQSQELQDATADGIPDLLITGALPSQPTAQYRIILTATATALIRASTPTRID